MHKKDIYYLAAVAILAIALLWVIIDRNYLKNAMNDIGNQKSQLHLLSGIQALKSTHEHADVKVYINGKAMDFSQPKYQLTTSFIHFEEGIGDVSHIHAKGLTIGHLFNSLGGRIARDCLTLDQTYCNEGNKVLKFYVNGKLNDEVSNYEMKDLDKYLITYGNEDAVAIQKQLDFVTSLAKK